MRIGSRVKIKPQEIFSSVEELAVGKRGTIVDEWENPWRGERQWIVEMEETGKRFNFYAEELEMDR